MISIAYPGNVVDDEVKKKNPLGATGRTVADNIKRLRGDMAYTKLAARLEEVGRPIPTLGLRKIESYERRVDADDLLALAVALGVSPITLLMTHPSTDRGAPVEVAGAQGGVTTEDLWAWLSAERPLPTMDTRRGTFQDNSLPQYLLDEFESLNEDLRQQGVGFVGDNK
jgi:hypothetical protein